MPDYRETVDRLKDAAFAAEYGVDRQLFSDALLLLTEQDAELATLRAENARYKTEQGQCWALLGRTYSDSCSSIPEALRDIAKRLKQAEFPQESR